MRRKTGFSLVELLVVISIIALLVSIILPSLNRANELAKRATCKGNFKAIAGAMTLYMNESNGVLPRTCSALDPTQGGWLLPTGNRVATDEDDALARLFDNTSANNVRANPTASLFLLVRSKSISVDTLVCPSVKGLVADDLSDGALKLLIDVKDKKNCGYSISYAWGDTVNWTAAASPGFPLASDKSPVGSSLADPTASDKLGNSLNHYQDGQNVLYRDGHADWKGTNRAGIGNDNIFTKLLSGNPTNSGGTAPLWPDKKGAYPRDTDDACMIFYYP